MPDDDDEAARTAFLRQAPPRARPVDSPSLSKGPPRMAIPVAQLPKTGLSESSPVPSGTDKFASAPSPVGTDRFAIPASTPEQSRVQLEAAEAARRALQSTASISTSGLKGPAERSVTKRESPAARAAPLPDDISLDNQAPVRVDPQDLAESNVVVRQTTHSRPPEKRETMTPETPGRYEMKREFGRGGQSSVWLALDKHIGRDVAFKQLLPHNVDPRQGASNPIVSQMAVRFLREARITGQLEHPSIVPVYEVGRRQDGSFYYTQKLIRGRTFTDALKVCTTLQERLGMLGHFIDLCQAIAYAHKRGVIHRDIKPDNVMVGEFGETVVLDWGLAKQLSTAGRPDPADDDDLAKTQEGDIMGTPAYMSPEQAQGRKRDIDAQSDVWSLGAVLYEILTGRPPFVGRNLMTMLIAVTKDPIPEPRSLESHVPPELAAIAMKALTRPRAERYSNAQEIIRDVEAWRTGGRVEAFRYTPWGNVARWLRHNRAVAITAACVIAALAIGSVRVGIENRVARKNLAQALLERAATSARELEWGKAAVYSAAAREEDDSAEARFRAAHRGPVEIDPILRVQLPGPVDKLALSPDGALCAVAITGMGVHLVGPNGQDTHPLEGINELVSSMIFSPDGSLLVVGSGSNVIVFNASSGEQETTLEGAGPVEQISFSADNSKLAFATGHSVRIYQVAGWRELGQLDGHAGQVRAVAFSPDQNGIATSGEDGTLRYWGPVPRKPGDRINMTIIRAQGHSPVTRLAFSPVGRVVIPSSVDGTVRFFDLDNGNTQVRIATNQGPVLDPAAATAGLLAALGEDNTVVLIDALTQTEVARLEGDDASTAVAFSADGGRLASANRDGKLRFWKVTPGARVYGFEPAQGFVSAVSLAFSPSGKQVAGGDGEGHIQLWESANGKRSGVLALPAGPVVALAWSPSGATIAAAGNDETISLFDIASGQRTPLEAHGGQVRALAFSPDGNTLAVVGQDGQIHLWDPVKQTERGSIAASSAPLNAVAYSRDGKLLGAAGDDKVAHVFDARTHRPVAKLDPSPDAILAIAFSPQNKIIATGGRDQAVRTFRMSNGKLRSVWNGHGARIYSVAFAPDGEILASASADGSVRLWDVLTGRQVVRMERAGVHALAFSADGKLLASAGERPPVQLVELDDTHALRKPAAELEHQLEVHKLRFEGVNLVDDVQAMQVKAWKPVPGVSPDESNGGAAE